MIRKIDDVKAAMESALPQLEVEPEDSWKNLKNSVHQIATNLLGRTKPGRTKLDKETWWWSDDVQSVIKKKKTAFRIWQKTKSEEARQTYVDSKRAAKRSVRQAKEAYVEKLYKKLHSHEEVREIYRIARSRANTTKDVEHFYCIKDVRGRMLRRRRR